MKTKATFMASPINISILNINSRKSTTKADNSNLNKQHNPVKLFKDVFKEIGYFSYDIFLLAIESCENFAKIAQNNKLLKPFFMAIEGLCLIVNIKDKLKHAHKEAHSKLRATIEIIGETASGIIWGLLLPDKIIQKIQNLFKAKKPSTKIFSGALALIILEILMISSGKISDLMAKWIDKNFNKSNISYKNA